jgi:hypothetical protein
MKYILIIKIPFISFLYINICHASPIPPLQEMNQDVFNETANHMTFKELREFATVNKAALEKVKQYFEYRKGLLANIQCPILTKNWVLTTKGATPTRGDPTVVPEQRRAESKMQSFEVTNLEGHTWQLKQLWVSDEKKLSETIYPKEKNGTVFMISNKIVKTCKYEDPGLYAPLSLIIYDEFLVLQ